MKRILQHLKQDKSLRIFTFSSLLLIMSTLLLNVMQRFGSNDNLLHRKQNELIIPDSGIVNRIHILESSQKDTQKLVYEMGFWKNKKGDKVHNILIWRLLKLLHRSNILYKITDKKELESLPIISVLQLYNGEKELNGITLRHGKNERFAIKDSKDDTWYMFEVPGDAFMISDLLKVEDRHWKDRTVFDVSDVHKIQSIRISYADSPDDGFEILKTKDFFTIQGISTIDSQRVYSYLELCKHIEVKSYLADSYVDSLRNLKPAFIVQVKAANQLLNLQIYFETNQKTPVMALMLPQQMPVIIRTSIFEYILQKRSFFQAKAKEKKSNF